MAKIIRKIFIILFLVAAAFANDNFFDKFDREFDGANGKKKTEFHQELRVLYVKSIMRNDKELTAKSLQRLIKSAKVLGLDTKSYEKELKSLPQPKAAPAPKKEKEAPKPKQAEAKEQKEAKQKPAELKQLSAPVNKKKSSEQGKLALVSVVRGGDSLELKFNRPLSGSDINKFTLNQKGLYRDIYEFKGVWSPGTVESIKGFLVDEVRISQFNAQTVRVVFANKFEINLRLRAEDKSLVFKKAAPAQEQKSVKKEKLSSKQAAAKENKQKSQAAPKQNAEKTIDLKQAWTQAGQTTEKKKGEQAKLTPKQEPSKTATKPKPKIAQTPQQKPAQPQAQNQKPTRQKQEKAQAKADAKNTQNAAKKEEQETLLPPVKTASAKKVQSAKGKVIVLDAGHGGDDPGAINGSLKEKNIVLSIAQKAGKELQGRGYKVYYTRSKDKFINLRDRTKYANDKAADLFISIHANAAPNKTKAATMHGIETFFLSPARSERSKNAAALENKSDIEEMNFFSKQTFLNFLNREKIIASNKLAIDVQREVLARAKSVSSKASDGGVREAPFWVLVGALMPAVLLEVGYITHPGEGELINNSKYQDALAKGLANGVDVYFSNQR
ncbi:N-acetylmuramoyl-L-alanine amidase [Campylobacter rectus RM3267]|uniref:N-acetylmuramoyl-L-alanine amidase n=2 Tax=Campylobacter rectus TaxID=203 RepID=A0A6G5QNB3_CAMRE|nr:N-acetylmuramoyl-L-alanine amidase [Campylobacter rectus]EEF13945.1 N-acetylmuramoyl-L-alanine amidase [Campylobacter rectus RM3267]QCD47233.1 N-acetylmuramoyl-L-alanine amidase [Campylobacter rectus]UEB47928.1 N-acetylmuramoyl-L-alanine amidase [Campylobacter rectus]